ncbi:MAG: RluA family pseudouridine synthase [Synergistaceae bacterium]|nr:RluA family pseudouridine synthase [Synergistaceae bacterium]
MRGSIEGNEVENFSAEAEQRLDVLISRHLGVTRSFAQKLIREGRVALKSAVPPGKALKPSYKPPAGICISVSIPSPEAFELEPEDVPFEVVYEDDCLLVVDKPAGLVVYPLPGRWKGTLAHGLLFRYPGLGPFDDAARYGVVHRLDAVTSGLMLAAREQKTMNLLQKAFAERRVKKEYIALAQGNFARPEGILEGPIGRLPQNRLKMAVVEGGRPSVTEYRVLWSGNGCSLVLCKPLTGRTHQIRVHMSVNGHPLVGDTLYGGIEVNDLDRVFLHSWRLSFTHPSAGRPLSFTSRLPKELRRVAHNHYRLFSNISGFGTTIDN